jgi:Uma2 family endonuclease
MAEQVSSPIQVDASKTGITFEQFLKLYDGKHAEWLVGDVLVHPSKTIVHQQLLSFLLSLLGLYVGIKELGQVMPASFTMFIRSDVPAREPDLMVILNEHLERLQYNYLDGAADICIEIVSPESVERDYGAKLREYWLLDPERRVFDIHVLQPNGVYIRNLLDGQGRVVSSLLPGFALDRRWCGVRSCLVAWNCCGC